MKIALIDPIGSKMGMSHYDDGLMKSLAEIPFQAFVFSNYKSRYELISSRVFFNNIKMPKWRAAFNNVWGMIHSIIYCRKQKMNITMLHIFRGGLFDLFSVVLSKLFNLKVLLIVHDIEAVDTIPNKYVKRIVLSKFHDFMVVHNEYTLDQLRKFIGTDQLKNTFVIRHGNYNHLTGIVYPRRQICDYFQLDPLCHYLLFFGQIKKSKGLDILLEAISYSKSNFKLIVAGKLRVRTFKPFQKIITRHQFSDRIILMLRYMSEKEASMLLTLCETLVLPYKTIYQSGVLLRALSLGKIVIVSDLPPFKEIIQHGRNGLLFSKNDPRALASIIDQVFCGTFDLEKIGAEAKQLADKTFSWPEIAKEYARLFS